MQPIIRVALLDDHEVVQQGLVSHLEQSPSICIIGRCGESRELLGVLARMPVDVVLLDYALSRDDMDGLSLIRLLAARYPALRILVVSAYENQSIMAKAVEFGASGFFSKSQDLTQLASVIAIVAQGHRYWPEHYAPALAAGLRSALTAREMEVIRCCLEGLSVTQIAAKYRRSFKTISAQKRSAFRKLGIQYDAELFKHHADLARLEKLE